VPSGQASGSCQIVRDFQKHILSQTENSFSSNTDINDVNEALENNLLRLEVFYKEFNYEEITETPAYEVRYRYSLV